MLAKHCSSNCVCPQTVSSLHQAQDNRNVVPHHQWLVIGHRLPHGGVFAPHHLSLFLHELISHWGEVAIEQWRATTIADGGEVRVEQIVCGQVARADKARFGQDE